MRFSYKINRNEILNESKSENIQDEIVEVKSHIQTKETLKVLDSKINLDELNSYKKDDRDHFL